MSGPSGAFTARPTIGSASSMISAPTSAISRRASLTFGPRFSLRKLGSRFLPFTQALFAGSHFSMSPPGISGGGTQFVFGLGGGSDLLLGRSGKFALRGQVEYFGIRANGGTTPTVRLGASIVHRIGKNSVTGR